jgi:glycosyltransferase involved in cell wall biosynthesis
MWPFQDALAAREDINFSIHLLGEYPDDEALIRSRQYVHRRLPSGRAPGEVWLLRGWNTPWLVLAAYTARARRIPLMLWHEPPGRTYVASSWKQAVMIRARELLLPQIFRAYRGGVLLGIGELAKRRFAALAPGSRVHLLPYPNHLADALLARSATDLSGAARAAPQLLFVGELSHRKAVDLLMAACEQLWREGEEFGIRFAGGGAMERPLRDHAARSGGRAEVLGPVKGDALLDLYSDSDGLVLPSRWDGWGLVVHEALAAGLPVVVSDACGAKMLVTNNHCGAVVRAGDPESLAEGLRWCSSLSEDERRAIRHRGRDAASALTMDRIADTLIGHAHEALA